MMPGKMERRYFDEKKQLAIDGLNHATQYVGEVEGLLRAWSYEVPNIVDPAEVHEQIRVAKARLDGVRYNFEKVRWSATETDLEFNDWLRKHGHDDLVYP